MAVFVFHHISHSKSSENGRSKEIIKGNLKILLKKSVSNLKLLNFLEFGVIIEVEAIFLQITAKINVSISMSLSVIYPCCKNECSAESND